MHNRAQLFFADRLRVFHIGAQAKQAHQTGGDQVGKQHHRQHQLHQHIQQQGAWESNFFRIQRGYGFRHHFGYDQHHQSQHTGGNRHPGIAIQAHTNNRGNGRSEDVNQVVANQDKAEQAIRALQQVLGTLRAAVSFFGHMPQPVAVQRHHAGFGAGKIGRN